VDQAATPEAPAFAVDQAAAPEPTDEPASDPAPRRRGRPRGSTRERILDVALELFNEQGYDNTSLRDIADRLGVTKAALYYHFERKEDIFLELHLRLHAIGRESLEQLANLSVDKQVKAWPAVFDHFLDQIFDNPDLFMLHVRNWNALKVISENERHQAENEDAEERTRQLLANPDIPVDRRVRMAAAIGAVAAVIAGAGGLFGDAQTNELERAVRDVIHDILEPGDRAS
jgi:AcrR family transcriptional regulator